MEIRKDSLLIQLEERVRVSMQLMLQRRLEDLVIKLVLEDASKSISLQVQADPSTPLHTLSFSQAQCVRLRDSKALAASPGSINKLRVHLLCTSATRNLHYLMFLASRGPTASAAAVADGLFEHRA